MIQHNNTPLPHKTLLAEEVALAININGISFAVMLASPYDIEDFIVGYLHSESIIKFNYDIHDINITYQADIRVVDVTLANRCLKPFKDKQRALKGTSGCGLCGSAALELAFPELPTIKTADKLEFDLTLLPAINEKLRDFQVLGQRSGALHGAFWLDDSGRIMACREDIGRHNALDKLIGHLIRSSISIDKGAILVTSRCGVELVQKTLLLGVSHLISLASPSTMALKLALKHNLKLIHLQKKDPPYYLTESNLTPNSLSQKSINRETTHD